MIHWLERGPFPMYFGYCASEKEWDDFFKRQVRTGKMKATDVLSWPKSTGCCTRFHDSDGAAVCIVTLNRLDWMTDAHLLGTVVHECVHVFQFLCEAIAEQNPSYEFEAYMTEHYFKEMVTVLTKLKVLTWQEK